MTLLVALLAAAAGVAHVDHAAHHGGWMGAAMWASGAALLMGAGAFLGGRQWVRWVAGATAAAYVVTRVVGHEPWDSLGMAVTSAELLVVVLPRLSASASGRGRRVGVGLVAGLLVVTALPAVAAVRSPERPTGCVTPTKHRTLYVEELPPAPDGSIRLGYGDTPGTASIPGPTIEMVEGDCLAVTVVNDVRAETLAALRTDPSLPLGVSLHVHGVKYTPMSDGTVHHGSYVPPGRSRTFVWYAAPLRTAGYWWYHDHVIGTDHGTGGVGAGLFGALVVRRPADPRPDHTFVVPMGPGVSLGLRRHPEVADFVAREGERVEFIAIGLGDGFHTFHLHAHNWVDNRTGMPSGPSDDTARIDNKTIGPADSFGFQVVAGEEVGPGRWMLHCHVQTHSDTGMMTFFRVEPADGAPMPAAPAGGGHSHGHGGH